MNSLTLLIFLEIAYVACLGQYSSELYPFLVKVTAEGKILECAGTIITWRTVLTSAHCVDGVHPSQVTVSHMSTTTTRHNVTLIIIHPEYKNMSLRNDIALVQTQEDFKQPWSAMALKNPKNIESFLSCATFQVAGWSDQIMKSSIAGEILLKDKNDFLEKPTKAAINLISNKECFSLIKNLGGVFQGDEKFCGLSHEKEEGSECFTGPGGPLLCSLDRKNFEIISSKPLETEEINHALKKDQLSEPIDLLESFKKAKEKKTKRQVHTDDRYVQMGVVSWGKTCSQAPLVCIRIDFYYDWILHNAIKINKNVHPYLQIYAYSTPSKGDSSRHARLSEYQFVILLFLNRILSMFLSLPF